MANIGGSEPPKKEWSYLSSNLPVAVAIRKFKEMNQEKVSTEDQQDSTGEKSDDRNTLDARIDEDEDNVEEIVKENAICSTVRSIREKFMQRKLTGKIYIHRMSGIISTAMTSHVTEEDLANYILKKSMETDAMEHDPLAQAEVSGQYKRALSMTDTILNSLERRSLAWDGVDFTHNTVLSRGSTMGISDPFLGLIGFSFTIQLSATVHSLLASRKRFECTRDIALSRRRGNEVVAASATEVVRESESALDGFMSIFRGSSFSKPDSIPKYASQETTSIAPEEDRGVDKEEL
jgi:hypothetical protein